jgi:anaerobic magnesium-protoporphyrin IX monomethyl ester cyclase
MMRALLVGPNQQENLALQYLAAAAEKAGHEARLTGYNGRDDLSRVLVEVNGDPPDLVGLGMAFQYTLDDFCLLARELRNAGFRGHITCGGHVPTFCHQELLRDEPALDSCVRHEGEATLVAMLDALGRGEPLDGIAGLVHRGPGAPVARPPVADLDLLATPKRDARQYLVAGVPIAFIITSRGCFGECSYCSIGAFSRDAGGPRHRTRSPDAVAEEIAECYRAGARIFFVQDDLFVLPSEAQTIARMRALRTGIDARGVVGAAFWIKGRPETITPGVLRAAREMGVLHLFLGIENACAERLAYLGRTHQPDDNWRAIALCDEHGIRPSFNLMLFDPDTTVAEIATNIDFAQRTAHLPWNVCRTEIYCGTALEKRLAGEKRLLGDYRTYGYVMRDPRAELMFRILRVALHERAFAFGSLHNRLISLSFASQVHGHLLPGAETDAINKEIQRLVLEVHRDTIEVMRQTLGFARVVDLADKNSVHRYALDLGLDLGQRDAAWHDKTLRLWNDMHARGIRHAATKVG